MTLKYKINFLDYWHLSSGLSAGAKLDSAVVKDKDGIAYVPGKTLKGLAREMAELLGNNEFVKVCFGEEGVNMGICYFSNAKLDDVSRQEIVLHKLQDKLYDEIASTKIDNGLAVDGSLREIEVVIPLTLNGTVNNIPEIYKGEMIKALHMIHRMGLNRNRGLGRCSIQVEVG